MHKKVLLVYREAHRAEAYREALLAARLTPTVALADDSLSLAGYHGLVLSGGSDVDPSQYGETRQEETEAPDHERDRVELRLIGEALREDTPVLAICRGLQILNVFHGGTLVQHIEPPERHRRHEADASTAAHNITIEEGTLLSQISGTRSWAVNSRHHQAVKELGKELRVSARDSEDGTIEALERPGNKFVLAVQWHPEDQIRAYPEQLRLFQSFGAAL